MFYLSLSNIKQQGLTTYPGSQKITAKNFRTSLSAKKGPKLNSPHSQSANATKKNFIKTNCNYNALYLFYIALWIEQKRKRRVRRPLGIVLNKKASLVKITKTFIKPGVDFTNISQQLLHAKAFRQLYCTYNLCL